ncbi:MAG: prepilin-type N-terminal cleavage/methylation domain-containing protein [Gemmatimonadetes bacterium]|nr:prepilin-type N-terminal cleavage/methylation domain-containing protein [Gemmatimonadota bacterium]
MTTKTAGLTLIEVLVAVVILTIGLLALAGATANVTKMVGYGKWATAASQVANRRLEAIRQIAKSTTPQCTSAALVSGGPVAAGAMTESWRITGTGRVRQVQVTVIYPRANRSVTDTVATLLRCN